MDKLIIEARINEYMMRGENPHVPWTPAEIAQDAEACRAAGASVVHYHARQADGAPDHRRETYEDIVRRIRARTDVLVHQTLGYVEQEASAEARLAVVMAMARDPATRPELAPIDTGSVNVDWYDPGRREFETRGVIYRNGTDTLEYFARNMAAAGVKPFLVCWNVSFLRQALVLIEQGLVAEPAYLYFFLTDGRMLAGHPGTSEGVDAHRMFLPKHRKIVWTVSNLGGSLLPVVDKVIREGGHLSIGLGDFAYPELGAPTNAELVRRVADRARELGRDVATPEETRRMLHIA